MARTGQRKYICLDCHTEFYMHPVQVHRRFIARCPGCGSASIEPGSQGAIDQLRTGQDAHEAQKETDVENIGRGRANTRLD